MCFRLPVAPVSSIARLLRLLHRAFWNPARHDRLHTGCRVRPASDPATCACRTAAARSYDTVTANVVVGAVTACTRPSASQLYPYEGPRGGTARLVASLAPAPSVRSTGLPDGGDRALGHRAVVYPIASATVGPSLTNVCASRRLRQASRCRVRTGSTPSIAEEARARFAR